MITMLFFLFNLCCFLCFLLVFVCVVFCFVLFCFVLFCFVFFPYNSISSVHSDFFHPCKAKFNPPAKFSLS